MNGKLAHVGLVVAVVLVLAAAPGAAQDLAPLALASPEVLVGSAFTYQGQLTKSGSDVNATCDMTFTLYDAAAAGAIVNAPVNASVPVASGLFTVSLSFGSSAFQGDARWLEIAVKCPGDASFATLTPRQNLTPAPYALSLRPGAFVTGAVGYNPVLFVRNDSSTIDTTGVEGIATSSLFGTGVFGYASASAGTNFGVAGTAAGDTGIGLYGQAINSSGANYGLYATSSSSSGTGVYGEGIAAGGTTYGVYGKTNSINGTGVYGFASAANGTGVEGNANRYAVTGLATATSGPAHGVGGRSDSDAGIGVWGYASSATGATYGVSGQADSTAGYGVSGYAPAASGTTYGVYGQADSTAGSGVSGNAPATSGTTYGVYGKSASTSGRGVAGHGTSTTGTNYGVLGRTNSASGYGVYSIGNFGASGSKAAIVQTRGYGWRHLYSMESPAVLFEDVGTAKLFDGRAVVEIDPIFAQTVNLDEPYQVFVTAQGDGPVLLWVAAKTSASFTVRGVTLDGQAATASFDYRIIAKRLGYEDVRLNPAVDPPTATEGTVPVAAGQ